jgi:hypothetical protein
MTQDKAGSENDPKQSAETQAPVSSETALTAAPQLTRGRMDIAVATLRPNPHRNLTRYPLHRDKIEALKSSVSSLGFWDNMLARPSPTEQGAYELAYGHHRLEAVKELGIETINISVRQLDDEAMIRIMAQENMPEWGHSATFDQETIRAVVEGLAAGRLKLPAIERMDGRGGDCRYAPSFSPSREGEKTKAYSAKSLAQFLGLKEYKVEAALAALALIEAGLATEQTFRELSAKQAKEVARQIRLAVKFFPEASAKAAAAKTIGKSLADGMRSGTLTIANAYPTARQILEVKFPDVLRAAALKQAVALKRAAAAKSSQTEDEARAEDPDPDQDQGDKEQGDKEQGETNTDTDTDNAGAEGDADGTTKALQDADTSVGLQPLVDPAPADAVKEDRTSDQTQDDTGARGRHDDDDDDEDDDDDDELGGAPPDDEAEPDDQSPFTGQPFNTAEFVEEIDWVIDQVILTARELRKGPVRDRFIKTAKRLQDARNWYKISLPNADLPVSALADLPVDG